MLNKFPLSTKIACMLFSLFCCIFQIHGPLWGVFSQLIEQLEILYQKHTLMCGFLVKNYCPVLIIWDEIWNYRRSFAKVSTERINADITITFNRRPTTKSTNMLKIHKNSIPQYLKEICPDIRRNISAYNTHDSIDFALKYIKIHLFSIVRKWIFFWAQK